MDWKKTFNLGQWIVHGIIAIGILGAVTCTLFAVKLNQLQSTEESRILKINAIIAELRSENSFEKIGKYISWAQADKANDKIKELTGLIAQLEQEVGMPVSPELENSVKLINHLINQSSGISSPADALRVLNQKVNNLLDIAKSNKYKTIVTISEKMLDRLEQLNPKNAGASIQISYLKSDLNKLQQVVQTSGLDEGEKSSLLKRFESMLLELDILTSLNSQGRSIGVQIKKSAVSLGVWLGEVQKKTEGLKGLKQKKQNQLIILLSSLVGFLTLSWIALAYFYRWQKNALRQVVENEVKAVVEKGIIADQRYVLDDFSPVTREEIVRLMDELKIKLTLGSLLHEGLPFAGCMIDNNFKLTWFNQLFLDQLYLSEEEVRCEAFNWDYVRNFLQLDEDPVYQALVNKIAGIYPVKMKQDDLTPALPYEMYVTPIMAYREERVMIFFYPLVSSKEAINEQVEMSKRAISEFVSLWNEDKLDLDNLTRLEGQFKVNDLIPTFNELSLIQEKVQEEKDQAFKTIANLESEVAKLIASLEEMIIADEERRKTIKEEMKVANVLRTSFLTTVEKSESLLQINRTILQQSDDYRTEAMRLHQLNHVMNKKNKETFDLLQSMESLKSEYKKIKFDLMEGKAKLISSNNSLLGQIVDESLLKTALKTKEELQRLDSTISILDKKLSQLDVLVAKLNMMHEGNPVEQTAFSFSLGQKDHEVREAIIDIQKTLNSEEQKIIDQFKSLHQLLRKDYHPPRIESENLLS